MRKIKITKDLRDCVRSFNNDLFKNSRPEGFKNPIDRLKDLHIRIKYNKHKQFKLYVEKIILQYDDILNATPTQMKTLIKEFDNVLDYSQLDRRIPNKKYSFHEEIVKAMRYEDLRNKEFPEFLLYSNIKTCVYCNSQSTLTIEPVYYNKKKKTRRKVLSKLQLDHFHPKSKYPFLSTSFFNLYPTCGNCNLAKGEKNALFELYTTEDDVEVFNFLLDDKSILDYWINLDLKSLKIIFETLDENDELLKNHNELFQIQKIYDAQKDIGEELVWKTKANPDVYRKTLYKSFHKIFPDESIIDRMIIGNYTKPEDTFKRPLAKYTQDIARQLKLIK
jgi:hypothetical protein